MGNRYWITGAQLGVVKGLLKSLDLEEGSKNLELTTKIDELTEEVLDNQWMGDAEDFDDFLEALRSGAKTETR